MANFEWEKEHWDRVARDVAAKTDKTIMEREVGLSMEEIEAYQKAREKLDKLATPVLEKYRDKADKEAKGKPFNDQTMDMLAGGYYRDNDPVCSPAHYTFSQYEVVDVLQAWFPNNPLLWQVGKYIARAEHKGNALQDLQKARWYLQREIDRLERIKAHE